MSRTQWICIFILTHIKFSTEIVLRVNVTANPDFPYYCQYCSCRLTSEGMYSDCNGKGLYRPPRSIDNRTVQLYLSRNRIRTVKNTSFDGLVNLRILDLSENTILRIQIGAFKDLTSLTHLYLNGQITRDLFVLQNVFYAGVFEGLVSLRVLHMHNCILSVVEEGLSRIPSTALRELSALEELKIDGVPNATFDENFSQLTNLTTLVMSGNEGACNIQYLDRKSLVGLNKVQNLTISNCKISTIKTGAFWWTSELTFLDLSWNKDLEIYNFGKVLEELKYTKLNILKINAIHNPYRAGTEILRPNVKYLRDIKLTDLYMDDNGIEFIDHGVFQMFPKTLKRLYLRRNRLNFGLYMNEAIFNNRNLEIFDAGDQKIIIDTDFPTNQYFSGVSSGGRYRRDGHVTHPRKSRSDSEEYENPKLELRILICSGSTLAMHPVDFSSTINNISFVDLSRNLIPNIVPKAFDGLYALQHLNLSSNYIEHVHEESFDGLYSLEQLALQNNLLGYTLHQDVDGRLLAPLTKLKTLNLSQNRITELGKNNLRYVTNLESVDLSNNYIENLDIYIASLTHLRFIDLRFNRLQSIPENIRTHLDHLSSIRRVSVNLGNNKLLCSCNNIPFIKWLFNSKVEFENLDSYYCALDNGTIKVFNQSRQLFLDRLEEQCKSYLSIIVGTSTGVSIIFAFIVSYLVYYNRWNIRYLYYMAKVKLDRQQGDGAGRENFQYDVFISYGDADRPFVVNDMLHNLETAEGIRLNIRDRDFEIGEVTAVNISKAIRTSKKTFLLLSRHFLRNKWCNFEMNMARMEAMHMKRSVIVVIFLETIPAKRLPIDLLDLLRECPNFDFPPEKAIQPAFWQKCIDNINMD